MLGALPLRPLRSPHPPPNHVFDPLPNQVPEEDLLLALASTPVLRDVIGAAS